MKPFIIPFFLSNQGCPARCIYCNQHISGGKRATQPTPETIRQGIEEGLGSPRSRTANHIEVAFFGGTFTGLSPARQDELLRAVGPFIDAGRVHGIRLSTRPDLLDEDQINFLKYRRVTTIELGAQSFDDAVLSVSNRAHSARDTRRAGERIHNAGLRLGLQLLPGLPGEDDDSREKTLATTLLMNPEDVRLYPLLVLKDTALFEWFTRGEYQPLSLSRAIGIMAAWVEAFTMAGVRIIRMGLQDEPWLKRNMVAGPYHPALGELVQSEIFHRALVRTLSKSSLSDPTEQPPIIRVAPRDLSQALGHKRRNITELAWRFDLPDLRILSDVSIARGTFTWQGRTFHLIPRYNSPTSGANEKTHHG
jgi:histone acetyltransferase (RNA polymerase elongator complex component)